MRLQALKTVVTDALADIKARDLKIIDVRGKTTITDMLVIASGTSDTHVKAIAELIIVRAKESGFYPLGFEGIQGGEWALIDLNDIVVHVMLPQVRDYYQLERLWGSTSPPAEISEKRRIMTL